ncbi:MAG: class I SAM-dependent methyltransferase [Pseudomonadota bacterium]
MVEHSRDPPLPISVTFGWDRKNPRINFYLYIKPRGNAPAVYFSKTDGFFYNNLLDPRLGSPLEIYYLDILKRYQIYLPVEIYEAFEEHKALDRYAKKEELIPEIKAAIQNCESCISPRAYANLMQDLDNPDIDLSNNLKIPIEDRSAQFKSYNIDEYYKQHKSVSDGLDYKKLSPRVLSSPSRPVPQGYKNRLFLGDGNFSAAASLFYKHNPSKNLGPFFTVTEYMSEETTQQTHGALFARNVQYLKTNGADVQFGIDARYLSDYFSGRRFHSIHFNFPHDRSNFKERTLPNLLKEFFKSAAEVQKIGDKIHIAIPKHPDKEKRKFYESYVYALYEAAAETGYRLAYKRPFGKERYPGYQHTKTGSSDSATVTEDAREYVFECIEPIHKDTLHIITQKSQPPKKTAYNETGYALPEMDTDDESTDDEIDRRIDNEKEESDEELIKELDKQRVDRSEPPPSKKPRI